MDQTTEALAEAGRLYNGSPRMNNKERYSAVVHLALHGVFSVGQLAQICGVSRATVNEWVDAQFRGPTGKFNPRTIDTLLQLRLDRLAKAPVNQFLLRMVLDNGNSQAVVARLTGLSQSTISRSVAQSATDLPAVLQ